ncbi:acyltransferase family protein [Phycicoccus flavus]|uniref:Acyltransferase n=1 Tax=Phycicoccus flavus TaxID=2502783 RepID=A0A8T6R0Y9_9MICO|nr:acyltransferase [Phycicoccus flavus]NHA67244.1 acyltransferase [Phycicoccus flavus]
MTLRPGTGRYPELTAVRGLAALAVVGTHAAYWTGRYQETTAGLVLARLDIGVSVFFALSGFLLVRPWLASAAGAGEPPRLSRYARDRVLRIVPGYVVTVLAAYLLVDSPTGTGAGQLLRSLTLTQVYPGAEQHLGLTQMWSLAVEVSFYVLLPGVAVLLVRLAGPRRRLALLAVLGAVTPLWWWLVRSAWSAAPPDTQYWLPGHLLWFVVGMALAVLAVGRESGRTRRGDGVAATPGSLWVLALAVFAVASTPLAGPATLVPSTAGAAVAKSLLYAAFGAALLAPLVVGSGSALLGWLRWPPLLWLGRVSYELFLVHLVVIEFVMDGLGNPTFTGDTVTVFLVTLGVSLLLAAGLHGLLSRLTGRGGPPGAGRRGRPARPGSAAAPPAPASRASTSPTPRRP